jgi:uncharacterized protein
MAMKMTGEYTLPADRQTVWRALNDPAALEASTPGCEEFEKVGDSEYKAVARVKVGPVKARFRGNVVLSDIDPPNSYRISGEGTGGVAGFAKGGAIVTLTDADGDGTVLTYEVDAQVGGKLAQVGQRLINGAAKKMADQFFDNFRRHLAPSEQDQGAA